MSRIGQPKHPRGLHNVPPNIEQPRHLCGLDDSHGRREQLSGRQNQESVRKITRTENAHRSEVMLEPHRQTAKRRKELQSGIGQVLWILDQDQKGEDGQETGDKSQPKHHAEWSRGVLPSQTLRLADQDNAEKWTGDGAYSVHGPMKAEGAAARFGRDGLRQDCVAQWATQTLAEPRYDAPK